MNSEEFYLDQLAAWGLIISEEGVPIGSLSAGDYFYTRNEICLVHGIIVNGLIETSGGWPESDVRFTGDGYYRNQDEIVWPLLGIDYEKQAAAEQIADEIFRSLEKEDLEKQAGIL